MAAEGWAEAVRQQLGLGRLLPLGGPADGAWITELAATGVLRQAAARLDGVRLGRLRISLADPESASAAAVPAPLGALPPGPVRISADCAMWTRLPLPEMAEQLRELLLGAAEHSLGLDVAAVDLRVTDLLQEPVPGHAPGEAEAEAENVSEGETGAAAEQGQSRDRHRVIPEPGPGPYAHGAAAVTAVPGVTRLAAAVGSGARPLRIEDETDPERRHVEVQLAVATSHRALDVARAVRSAVTAATAADTSAPVTVAVVVTAVEPP